MQCTLVDFLLMTKKGSKGKEWKKKSVGVRVCER